MHRLASTEAFRSKGMRMADADVRSCPGMDPFSDEYWECHVRHWLVSVYHLSGTCRMGPAGDAGAVVDSRLRVRGVRGLRVADASVMPKLVGANTNAACIMIGEKAADFVLDDWGMGEGTLEGAGKEEL